MEAKFLDKIEVGGEMKTPFTMIHGEEGVGKTTNATKAEEVLMLMVEDGRGKLKCHHVKPTLLKTYDNLMGFISELLTVPHRYKNVCIDTLDATERLIFDKVCSMNGRKDISSFGYGKGYEKALSLWKMLLDALYALREEKGMGVILLAHSKIERYEDPERDSYDRFVPCLNRHASSLIQGWCDTVLFATKKVYIKSTEEGFNRISKKGVGSDERVFKTTSNPAFVAKNRIGLPLEIPLDWDAYISYYNTTTIKKKSPRKVSVS